MAIQTKVHSDLQPVGNFDQREYSTGSLYAVTSGDTVQPQGPKLDFATVTFTGHATGAQIKTVVDTIQQLATVYVYEFTTGGSNDTFAFASYPTGAWASGLDTAIAAAGISGTTTTATATFTN